MWVGEGGDKIGEGRLDLDGVQLDNDGNAFVVMLGGGSCASGTSEIEASLESAPYTTYTTTFTILPPQPTLPVRPGFTIEKLQRFGGEATFTKNELTGQVGRRRRIRDRRPQHRQHAAAVQHFRTQLRRHLGRPR